MTKFDEREKSFEKKFVNDQELQFKVSAKRNKYLGEWVANLMKKNDQEKEDYINQVIKSDFAEPGDQDVFKKIKKDLEAYNLKIEDSDIRKKMDFFLERAKKDYS